MIPAKAFIPFCKSLISQGVKGEEGMRAHVDFADKTCQANPSFDVLSIRVNPADPSGPPLMG